MNEYTEAVCGWILWAKKSAMDRDRVEGVYDGRHIYPEGMADVWKTDLVSNTLPWLLRWALETELVYFQDWTGTETTSASACCSSSWVAA